MFSVSIGLRIWITAGAPVNMVLKLRFYRRHGINRPTERVLASKKGLSSMELVMRQAWKHEKSPGESQAMRDLSPEFCNHQRNVNTINRLILIVRCSSFSSVSEEHLMGSSMSVLSRFFATVGPEAPLLESVLSNALWGERRTPYGLVHVCLSSFSQHLDLKPHFFESITQQQLYIQGFYFLHSNGSSHHKSARMT
jgi:hypothetical protein